MLLNDLQNLNLTYCKSTRNCLYDCNITPKYLALLTYCTYCTLLILLHRNTVNIKLQSHFLMNCCDNSCVERDDISSTVLQQCVNLPRATFPINLPAFAAPTAPSHLQPTGNCFEWPTAAMVQDLCAGEVPQLIVDAWHCKSRGSQVHTRSTSVHIRINPFVQIPSHLHINKKKSVFVCIRSYYAYQYYMRCCTDARFLQTMLSLSYVCPKLFCKSSLRFGTSFMCHKISSIFIL